MQVKNRNDTREELRNQRVMKLVKLCYKKQCLNVTAYRYKILHRKDMDIPLVEAVLYADTYSSTVRIKDLHHFSGPTSFPFSEVVACFAKLESTSAAMKSTDASFRIIRALSLLRTLTRKKHLIQSIMDGFFS